MTPNEMRNAYDAKISEIVSPLGNRTNAKGKLLSDAIIEWAPDGNSTIDRWEAGIVSEKFVVEKLNEIYAEIQKGVNRRLAE